MPAWTPDLEGLAPFDDDDELKDAVKPEFANFLAKFEIRGSFSIEVKKWKNENYAGRPILAGTMDGVVPIYESVVAINGPGFYGFDTTWTPKGGKPRTEMLKVALVGPSWDEVYKKAKKEKEKFEVDEARHEAEIERARNAGNPVVGTYQDPAKSGREYMKSMLGDMKDLADTFGLGGGGGGPRNAPPGGEMGMMMLGMMQMMSKQSENQMNLVITLMSNNNKGSDMKETFGMFRELLGVRESLMPKDRSWIEEIVGAVADNLGPIAGLFMRGNPEDDPLHQKMNEGLAETRERAQEDPAFLKSLVKHMDTKVGPKMTDKILNGFLNVTRPAPKAPAAPEGAPTHAAPQTAGDGEE